MALLSSKTGLPSFTNDQTSFINYFTDGGFERGTNGVLPAGWTQYNDGAVAIPVDGTGGTPDATVTMLCSNSSPIRGALSAVITKPAGDKRGIGFSFPFTISQADKGFTAGVEFDMDTDALFAAGDVVFYVYDVTNSILITPRNVSVPKLDNFGRFVSDYGLTAGTSYRFILHIATVNASAWTLKLDTMVNTTTRVAVPGSAVYVYERVSSYIIGATATPPTPGSGATFYRETVYNGDGTATIRFEFRQANAGVVGSGDYLFPIPNGLTIDYTRTNVLGTTQNGCVGEGTLITGATNFNLQAHAQNSGLYTNKIYISASNETSASVIVGTGGPALNGNPYSFGFTVRVAINEWAGAGANFGPSSNLEYFSHNGTTTVNDWSLVPNIAGATGNTAVTLTPVVACQPGDTIAIQLRDSSGAVYNIFEDPYPFITGTSSFAFGILLRKTPSGGVTLNFGNGGANLNNGLGAAGTDTWASLRTAGYMYRIRKANPTAPVGVAIAGLDGSAGYYKAGQAPGEANGTAIVAGYIGEIITACNWSAQAIAISPGSVVATSGTIQKGTYLAALEADGNTGSAANVLMSVEGTSATIVNIGALNMYYQNAIATGQSGISRSFMMRVSVAGTVSVRGVATTGPSNGNRGNLILTRIA